MPSPAFDKSLTDYLKLRDPLDAMGYSGRAQRTERARIILLFLLLHRTEDRRQALTAEERLHRELLIHALQSKANFIDWNCGDSVLETPGLVTHRSGELTAMKLTEGNFDRAVLGAPDDFLDLMKVKKLKDLDREKLTLEFKKWVEDPKSFAAVEGLVWYGPAKDKSDADSEKQLRTPMEEIARRMQTQNSLGGLGSNPFHANPGHSSRPEPPLAPPTVRSNGLSPFPLIGVQTTAPRQVREPRYSDNFFEPKGISQGQPNVLPQPKLLEYLDSKLGEDPTYEEVENAEREMSRYWNTLYNEQRGELSDRIQRARSGKRYALSFLSAEQLKNLKEDDRNAFVTDLGLLVLDHRAFGRIAKLIGDDAARDLLGLKKFELHFGAVRAAAIHVAFEKALKLEPLPQAQINRLASRVFGAIGGALPSGEFDALARRWLAEQIPSVREETITALTAQRFAQAAQVKRPAEFDELFAMLPGEAITKDLIANNSLKLDADGQKYLKLRYDLFRRSLHLVELRKKVRDASGARVHLSVELATAFDRALGKDWRRELSALTNPQDLIKGDLTHLTSVDRAKLLAALGRAEVASRISPSEAKHGIRATASPKDR